MKKVIEDRRIILTIFKVKNSILIKLALSRIINRVE